MKLSEHYKQEIDTLRINESLSTIQEQYSPLIESEEMLTEGIGNMLSKVKDFFTNRKVKSVGGLALQRPEEDATFVVMHVDGKYEGVLVEGKTVQERFQFDNKSHAMSVINELKDEGFKVVKKDRDWKKIIKRLLFVVGISLLVGGTLYFIGPALILFGGWMFGAISTVAGWAWAGATAAGGFAQVAAGFLTGAGATAAGGSALGAAVGGTAKTLALTAASAYGGWKLLKISDSIKTNDNDHIPTA
jgi:hypothetical protein